MSVDSVLVFMLWLDRFVDSLPIAWDFDFCGWGCVSITNINVRFYCFCRSNGCFISFHSLVFVPGFFGNVQTAGF